MELNELMNKLCPYKYEKEWFEFKESFDSSNELGEYISELSNLKGALKNGHLFYIHGLSTIEMYEIKVSISGKPGLA